MSELQNTIAATQDLLDDITPWYDSGGTHQFNLGSTCFRLKRKQKLESLGSVNLDAQAWAVLHLDQILANLLAALRSQPDRDIYDEALSAYRVMEGDWTFERCLAWVRLLEKEQAHRELTDKSAAIVSAYHSVRDRLGYDPSVREVSEEFGACPSHTQTMLEQARGNGYHLPVRGGRRK